MIAVIDYGAGNIFSVVKAFRSLGEDVALVSRPEGLGQASAIVLPGVGAFRSAVVSLAQLDLTSAMMAAVLDNGKPFLGICLGMQVLADEGTEGGVSAGLGWIGGRTTPLADLIGPGHRLPHVGWDDVHFDTACPLFRGLPDGTDFYFVHSYHMEPDDRRAVAATCEYGGRFAAALWQENIFATQFHPEKSQEAGLRVLSNFLDWKG